MLSPDLDGKPAPPSPLAHPAAAPAMASPRSAALAASRASASAGKVSKAFLARVLSPRGAAADAPARGASGRSKPPKRSLADLP